MDFNDYEAEQKFTSCILFDTDVLLELNVNSNWFSMTVCRDIVSGALSLVENDVDYTHNNEPLVYWLSENRDYSRQEALKLISEYAADYVPAHHASYYVERVKNSYNQRQIITLSERIIRAATSGDDNILSRARMALDEIEKRTASDFPITITAEYLLTTDFPEPEWIVPGILPAGLAFLAGKPKAGKSWFALQLSHAVGTGSEFMLKRISKGKVLYLALEDSHRRLAKRMKIQGWHKEAQVRFITHENMIVNPLDKGGVDKILYFIDRHKYSLVVIDTLTRAIDSDQFSPQDMKRTLSPLQAGALKHNACVLLIDHMPKLSGNDEDVINDVFGSVSKVGIADTIIGFYRDRGSNTGKLAGVGRDIEEFSFSIKYSEKTGMWLRIHDTERARYSEQRHLVLQYVKDVKNASVTAVAAGLGINKGSASRVLKDLLSDNLVIVFSGRQTVYGLSQVGQAALEHWNERAAGAKKLLLAE